MQPKLTESDLAQFHGSETIYLHWSKRLTYTQGVKFVAERAAAYWLLDAIASYQPRCQRDPMLRDFQLWELDVTGRAAVLTCRRDSGRGEKFVVSQRIEYTDFPLDSLRLYLCNGTLLLPPSEY